MKAKQLIKILEQHPERDVIFWDGEDNWDVNDATPDDNEIEIVLTY